MEIDGGQVKRSEYIAAAALGFNLLTLAFGVGVYFNTIQVQGKDIADLKAVQRDDRRDFEQLRETVVRIDANVTYLADRAREDRARMDRRR